MSHVKSVPNHMSHIKRENEFDEALEDTTEEAMSNCSRIKYRIVEHLFQQTYENGSRKGKTVYV